MWTASGEGGVAAVGVGGCGRRHGEGWGGHHQGGRMGPSSGAGMGVAVMGGECDYLEICRDGSHCSEMA